MAGASAMATTTVAVTLLVALALPHVASAEEPAGVSLAPETAAALARIHARDRDFAVRLRAVSALFVGAPFADSPLGEGQGYDADPVLDVTRFDCVTYVEQVMAFSAHERPAEASALLQRIRYTDGTIRYGARKHIMMAQWLPQNVAAGFVRDVTAEVAGAVVARAPLTIASGDFEHGKGAVLALAPADRPVGRHEVPIVPVRDMLRLVRAVPDGSIITTIRQARAGQPYRASHVGLVVVVGSERRLRHAHKRSGRVIDEPLAAYVRRSAAERRWRVDGYNFVRVVPPGS